VLLTGTPDGVARGNRRRTWIERIGAMAVRVT